MRFFFRVCVFTSVRVLITTIFKRASGWAAAMPPKLCEREGCTKQAKCGGTPHCRAHGGGKRCKEENCTKSAIGDTGYCIGHGGGRRCQLEGCTKAAAGGGTPHCMAHGGGKHCQKELCFQLVYGAENVYCKPCLQATQTDSQ
jgi:hypothetical protein